MWQQRVSRSSPARLGAWCGRCGRQRLQQGRTVLHQGVTEEGRLRSHARPLAIQPVSEMRVDTATLTDGAVGVRPTAPMVRRAWRGVGCLALIENCDRLLEGGARCAPRRTLEEAWRRAELRRYHGTLSAYVAPLRTMPRAMPARSPSTRVMPARWMATSVPVPIRSRRTPRLKPGRRSRRRPPWRRCASRI